MEELLAGLKAIGESTRLRILFALSHGEMNVSELVHILEQSQPRVSRHLKLMTDAGLVRRHKEGNWVLFRLRDDETAGTLARSIVKLLPPGESILKDDLDRLEQIQKQRSERAAAYFSDNAGNWERLRSMHVQDAEVEEALLKLVGSQPVSELVDMGTGTGRMLELLSGHARNLTGLDLSREMLAIARAKLENGNLRNAQVRQANIYSVPLSSASADVVTIHQVLHFLDDPQRALMEARRILKPGGRLFVVDFAPHDVEELRELHAHRRLGLSSEQMGVWLSRAGLVQTAHATLPPPWTKTGKGLTVSLWRAEAPDSSGRDSGTAQIAKRVQAA